MELALANRGSPSLPLANLVLLDEIRAKLPSFYPYVNSQNARVQRIVAGPRERSALRMASVIPPHFRHEIMLVSTNQLLGLATRLQGGGFMVDAIRELVQANPDADRESLALAPGVEEERGSVVERGVQQEEEGLNVAWTMTSSSNKSNVPHDAAFPTTLPPCNLDGSTLHTPYGLKDSELPAKIQVQLREFERWSTEPINLARGREYATPVQEATIAKQLELIRGYLGFMATKLGQPIVGLHNYWEPKTMAAFASMLLARGVGKHQVIKHLALARKVNTFLVCSSNLEEERHHANKMEAWLATLERQVAVVLPKPIKDASSLPKAGLVRKNPAFFIYYSKVVFCKMNMLYILENKPPKPLKPLNQPTHSLFSDHN